MLPVDRAEVRYPDGSVYQVPADGSWAEAPPFGVQCVVYYHVPDPSGLQRRTYDGGEDVYVWRGEQSHPDYAGHKMGLWLDHDGFYRVQDMSRTRPEA